MAGDPFSAMAATCTQSRRASFELLALYITCIDQGVVNGPSLGVYGETRHVHERVPGARDMNARACPAEMSAGATPPALALTTAIATVVGALRRLGREERRFSGTDWVTRGNALQFNCSRFRGIAREGGRGARR